MQPAPNLLRRPARSDSHHYADWLELSTLLNFETQFSRADAARDLLRTFEVDDQTDDEENEEIEEVAPGVSGREARVNRYIEDAVRQILRRLQDYGASYPFELSADRDVISLRRPSRARSVYLALLLASCKVWIAQSRLIETSFEELTHEAVRQWLGREFEIHACGTSTVGESRYARRSMKDKVELLAEDLGAELVPGVVDKFRPGDSGDGGLDVVAWHSRLDGSNGNLCLFVQATTSPRFEGKWNDVQPDRWRQLLFMKAQAVPVLAVPFSFRDTEGQWSNPGEVQSILLDRLRLTRLLVKSSTDSCHEFVEQILS
jgi:hypothetical protein